MHPDQLMTQLTQLLDEVTGEQDHTWTCRVATAWQRLEQARNVLLTQALETRHTLDLPPTYQHLATEYDHLRQLLTGPPSHHPPNGLRHGQRCKPPEE